MSEAELWEIVDDVAAMEPFVYNDNCGDMECVFCGQTHDNFEYPQQGNHLDDCTYIKALRLRGQKLIAERTQAV